MKGGFATRSATLTLVVALLLGCANERRAVTTIEVWGLGREGEVVAGMVPEFERRNPGIRVDVQQIPWTAAHEKMLTAHVGRSLPDVVQMGNTWVPEFVTVGALEDLGPFVRSGGVPEDDYFGGTWQANVVDGVLYGIPWYVDTRVLFYRRDLFAAAGFPQPPRTWDEWTKVCAALKAKSGRSDFFPFLLPTNEWPQPVALAVGNGATLVGDDATARFSEPAFREAFAYYLAFFRKGHAPVVNGNLVANLYQQFAEGEFAMMITGPWNVGELRRRLPAEQQALWTTAPLPAPPGSSYPGLSIAGGSSLVIPRVSDAKDAAWKFITYLSEPEQQIHMYRAAGDLPARRAAWADPVFASDREIAAFRAQLDRTAVLPRVPEWEYIATTIFEHGELAARGQFDADRAAELLDRKVNRILEKRRWLLEERRKQTVYDAMPADSKTAGRDNALPTRTRASAWRADLQVRGGRTSTSGRGLTVGSRTWRSGNRGPGGPPSMARCRGAMASVAGSSLSATFTSAEVAR